jgi:hypothetical protein
MKLKAIIVTAVLAASTIWIPLATASEKPVVESFTFTPNEIDLASTNTLINIELIVSHPSGIENTSVLATFTSSRNDTLTTLLTRTDSPVNTALSKVTFKGSISIPRLINTGVYVLTVANVKNNSSAGYQFETGIVEAKKVRTLLGAESGLLVRNNGDLNLVYDTFVGPSYDTTLGIAFNDLNTYKPSNTPIWKVGETYTPSKYYELRVTSLALEVKSSTPTVCSSNGKEISLIKEGTCSFTILTPKTKDYVEKFSNQSATITAARVKPILNIEKIANQTSKDLPKTIEIFRVYSPAEGYVLPQSITPESCIANGFFTRLISGGTCTLTFQTADTSSYLASDLYKSTFEITRDSQTITFATSAAANVSSKSITLTASASGGGVITYSTTSAGICSITGSTLNLLKAGNCSVTATQAGTATLAPVSATATLMLTGSVTSDKKSITCVKGKSTKKISGSSPKCPTGYKLKK